MFRVATYFPDETYLYSTIEATSHAPQRAAPGVVFYHPHADFAGAGATPDTEAFPRCRRWHSRQLRRGEGRNLFIARPSQA